VLVVGDDQTARLYELATGELLWSRRVDGAAAAFVARGSVVVIAGSTLVELDATTGRPRGKPVSVALPGVAEELVPSADGASAIVLVGKPRARAIALATGARLGRVKHVRGVTDAAFGPGGRIVASSGRDSTGRLWSTETWNEAREPLLGHGGQVLTIAFDRAGDRIATGSTDQTGRVWWARTGKLFTTLFGHTGYVSDIAFGPGSALVTASTDGTARTWRANGAQARELLGHQGPVRKAEFVSGGTVVTGGADGEIRTWDPGTAIALVPSPGARLDPPRLLAVAADGSARATADGHVVRLRTSSGKRVLEGHDDDVNAVSFSPDGTLLVSAGSDHDVVVWDVATGAEAFRIDEAQSASVGDARFSPDGRWLVTAGRKSARLWTGDGHFVRSLYGPKDPLTAVGFEPDSRSVVSREEGGVVRRWRCELCGGLDELVSLAEKRLRGTGRSLTDEERDRYLG
jgi:WD40 repeat protein